MKIVTPTGNAVTRQGGIAKVIATLAEAGFDGVDITMTNLEEAWNCDTKTFIREAKQALADCHIEALQAHAPFPGRRFGDAEYNARLEPAVICSMEVAAALGVPAIVIHPLYCPTLTASEQMAFNMAYYRELAPVAKSLGIRIAVENMYRSTGPDHFFPNVCSVPSEHAAYLDELASDVFVGCVDVGHYAMLGIDPAQAIREMGHRVGTLHIHDNNRVHDLHLPPFMGYLKWESIAEALAEIGYQGHFTFETHMPSDQPPALFLAAHTYLAAAGRYLVSRIEDYQIKK